MWILWSERNCHTLEDAEESKFQMKISFIRNLVNGYFIQKKKKKTLVNGQLLRVWVIVVLLQSSLNYFRLLVKFDIL